MGDCGIGQDVEVGIKCGERGGERRRPAGLDEEETG
jgi:hypothetical protein